MKKILFAVAFILSATATFAQDDEGGAYSKGQSTVAIGYGFLSPYKTLFKLSNAFSGGTAKYSAIGPIGLTYEYGVAEHISMGLQLAYGTITNKTTYTGQNSNGGDLIETDKLTQVSAIVRGNYHFGSSSKFDPYIGLGLGYGNFKYKSTSNDASYTSYGAFSVPTSFGITGQLGAKYYFSQNVGIYAELGYLAGAFAQVGVAFKF